VIEFRVKLPDVGEGVAEAELVEWNVEVGEEVTPDTVLADVMTDKATVEISSPVTGVVTFLIGEPGDVLAVGTEFVGIEIAGNDVAATDVDEADANEADDAEVDNASPQPDASPPPEPAPAAARSFDGKRPTAAPAVRARAASLGIDLTTVTGSGPEGRVLHQDLDRGGSRAPSRRTTPAGSHEEQVIGLRRRISERLTASWTEIPHITYVEAIDATELEVLRGELNRQGSDDAQRLTILPFLVRAIVIACREQPRLNAHFDAAAGTLSMHDAVHVGIATQTDDGLLVPVVHGADELDLRRTAAEIARVTTAARDGSATRDELGGSTITITSLGALGGLVTTPIINQPEVAIVGVNKLETRPVWRDGAFVPRQMFNLSSSFDHRIVDGWDAATFIQRIKALIEMPALLFLD
jgi:2-oxoisovalerate dehydrogenase E2 component (dihydrolipoyl transacylase)